MAHNRKGLIPILLGLLLLSAALFLTLCNLYDQHCASQSVQTTLAALEVYRCVEAGFAEPEMPDNTSFLPETTDIPNYVICPDMEMPVQTIDGIDYIGILEVPELALELPVISQWSYPNLKLAPCRYSGSAYSGELVIAGHNYTAHFGNLKSLRKGDSVLFTDNDGNTFHYKVDLCEILRASDVEDMIESDWDLTLFTCTVGGQNRVAVRCVLEKG